MEDAREVASEVQNKPTAAMFAQSWGSESSVANTEVEEKEDKYGTVKRTKNDTATLDNVSFVTTASSVQGDNEVKQQLEVEHIEATVLCDRAAVAEHTSIVRYIALHCRSLAG